MGFSYITYWNFRKDQPATSKVTRNQSALNVFNCVLLIGMHLAGLLAFLFRPRLLDILLCTILHVLTAMGVTIGFHRLLAHRGFECSPWLMRFWVFWGTASLQGSPIWWVGIHRKHHQAVDREGDPHSPIHGFWHSHFGWFCRQARFSRYTTRARDIARDPFLILLENGVGAVTPWLMTVAFCFLVGGWQAVLWGGVVRTLSVWHATWCVNSVCHRWGSRPLETPDQSRNVWWVALWAMGEGWHNYHHAHPQAALHTCHWWEVDLSGLVLIGLEKVRLVTNVINNKMEAKQ